MSANENRPILQDGSVDTALEHGSPDSTLSPLPVNQIPKIRSPRYIRGIRRLLYGEVCREDFDRVTGSSNSPDIVSHLRHRHGFRIACECRKTIDRDGRWCEVGWYSMSDETSRMRARAVLAREACDA